MFLRKAGRKPAEAPAASAPAGGALLDDASLAQLERIRFASPDDIVAGAAGLHLGPRRIQAIEFSDYRGYTPGDDFRQIDWNAYARLGELFLKTSRSEETIDVSILLDCSRSMNWGEPNKLQFARILAAELGAIALLHYDSVRTFALREAGAVAGTAFRGPSSLPYLVQDLAAVPASGIIDLRGGLAQFRRVVSFPDLIILLSDLLVPDEQLDALGTLRQGGAAVVIQVVSPQEVTPDWTGPVELHDVESGRSALFDVGPELQEAYAQRFARRTEQIAQRCAANGVAYVQTTSDSALPQLIQALWRSGVITAA